MNGLDLTKLNHTDAVGHLRNAKGQVRIRVYRPPQATAPVSAHPQVEKPEPIRQEDSEEESEEEVEDGGETMNSGYEPDSMASTADLTSVTQVSESVAELVLDDSHFAI